MFIFSHECSSSCALTPLDRSASVFIILNVVVCSMHKTVRAFLLLLALECTTCILHHEPKKSQRTIDPNAQQTANRISVCSQHSANDARKCRVENHDTTGRNCANFQLIYHRSATLSYGCIDCLSLPRVYLWPYITSVSICTYKAV